MARKKTDEEAACDRKRVLDAFAANLVSRGYAATRLSQVATESGWCRQSIHKEYGDKCGLMRALGHRLADQMCREWEREFRLHGEPHKSVYHATVRVLRFAEQNPVISSAIARPDDEFIYRIATGVGPILDDFRSRMLDIARKHWLDPTELELADVVHIVVSTIHRNMLCRSGSIEDVARAVSRVVGGCIETRKLELADRDNDPMSDDPMLDPRYVKLLRNLGNNHELAQIAYSKIKQDERYISQEEKYRRRLD